MTTTFTTKYSEIKSFEHVKEDLALIKGIKTEISVEQCQLNILYKCPGCQKSIDLHEPGKIVRCEFCKMKQRRNNLIQSRYIKMNIKEIETGKFVKKKSHVPSRN